MKSSFGQFKPLRTRDAIENSESLDYDPNDNLDKFMTRK